jgi:hypothetical protein
MLHGEFLLLQRAMLSLDSKTLLDYYLRSIVQIDYLPCCAPDPTPVQIAEPPLIGSDAPFRKAATLCIPTSAQSAASARSSDQSRGLVEGRVATAGELAIVRRLIAKP